MNVRREDFPGGVTLYLGDSREILPSLDCHGKIDAVIADPPYGIGYFHSGGGGQRGTLKSSKEVLAAASRRSFQGRAAMIVGDDEPFDPSPWLGFPRVVLWGANHFADRLPSSSKWLVWDKIQHAENYGKFSQADCEMAWTNQKGTARIYHHLWLGLCRAGERGPKRKLHPNQKPIQLMQWCMDQVKVPPGGLVLDPFTGSGTTVIAAMRCGFRVIGIEKDPKYFEIALARVREEVEGNPLFAREEIQS